MDAAAEEEEVAGAGEELGEVLALGVEERRGATRRSGWFSEARVSERDDVGIGEGEKGALLLRLAVEDDRGGGGWGFVREGISPLRRCGGSGREDGCWRG